MAGPIKDTEDARQGKTGTGTRYVLAISLTAVIILLIGIAWAFVGPPTLGLDRTGNNDVERHAPVLTPEEADNSRR